MYTIFHINSSEVTNRTSETISFKKWLHSTSQKAWSQFSNKDNPLNESGMPYVKADPNQYIYVVANIKYSKDFPGGDDCMIELNWNISGSVNSIL